MLRASQRLRAIEQRIFETVDAVATPSFEEAVVIREMVPRATVVVLPPFMDSPREGSARPEQRSALPVAERTDLLFVGGFAHRPNADAVRFLVREIMPAVWAQVPEARLEIVGPDAPADVVALGSERVLIRGHVADLAPFYARARMTVSPLRFGAGVKGKIIASVEAGVPVVTTTLGNEGIGLRNGSQALIADDPQGLAAAVIRLYREPELGAQLAGAARQAMAQRFSRRAAAAALDALLGRSPEAAGI